MVGVRGKSPSMPSQRRKEDRFCFSLGRPNGFDRVLNEKQKTLRGDWLRVNKNSILHLLTFDPYYVWHSALSSFVRFFRYRLVGRASDRTSLRLSGSPFSQRRRLYNVYHDSMLYHICTSVRCRFFLHVQVRITWENIHLAHSTRPYLFCSVQNENFILKEKWACARFLQL